MVPLIPIWRQCYLVTIMLVECCVAYYACKFFSTCVRKPLYGCARMCVFLACARNCITAFSPKTPLVIIFLSFSYSCVYIIDASKKERKVRMTAKEYKVRVDLVESLTSDDAVGIWRRLGDSCNDLFVVEEHEGKVHYHAYVKTSKQKATMAGWLKYNFKVSGTQYECKEYDAKKGEGGRYFMYMCKGIKSTRGDEVRVIVDQMGRMVKELHEQYHANAEEYAAKSKTKRSLYDQIADECKAKGWTSKSDVMRAVINNRFVNNKAFDEFMIVKFFWPVYMRVNEGGAQELHDRCMERIRA